MAALAQASGKISPLQLVSWPGVFDRRLKRADFKEDRCAVVVGGDNQPLLDNRGIVSWQTAILLAHRDDFHVVEYHEDKFIMSSSGPVRLPKKIMMKGCLGQHNRAAALNIHNLMIRDGGLCQYTGNWVMPHHSDPRHCATIEHIVPRGGLHQGENCWQNVTLACAAFNTFKACRTPQQLNAGYKLLIQPWVPHEADLFYLLIQYESEFYDRWREVFTLPRASREAEKSFKFLSRLRPH
jgi:hypothetical protein